MSSQDSNSATSRQYYPSKWDLSELLPDTSEETISVRFAELERLVQRVEARRNALEPSMPAASLLSILREYEEVMRAAEVLRCYGALSFSANTKDGEALAFQSRAEQAYADAMSRIRFVTLWWQSLSDEEAETLLPAPEAHVEYRHFLKEQRRLKPYALGEEAERIIALKNANGIDAMARLHMMYMSALRFPLLVDGEERLLTDTELYPYRYSPDPSVRLAAYDTQSRVIEEAAPILAQMFANRVHDWHGENVRLRGYSSSMNVRTVADDFSDDVVDLQLETVRKNAPLFQRFLRIKARLLGMERLRSCDILAPLSDRQLLIPYSEAVPMILDAFREFDPRIGALAQRIFDLNHIDSEVREGKETGLFCYWVAPEIVPWILISYTELFNDAIGLAHELGHAVQNMLASHHTALTYCPLSNPLAEVPSLFAEQLFLHKLLASPMEQDNRKELLGWALDEICSAVYLGINALFERDAHNAVLAGQPAGEINRLYAESLRDLYEDAVGIDESAGVRWVRIMHYHFAPFYIYAYSFAALVALALYRNVQLQGDPAREAVFQCMAAGGSARPETILREAGIDIHNPDFWQGGFDVISEMIDELESLS